MELNVERQPMNVNETVYSGALEQSVEYDALLADYCPDIVKILKCSVSPYIMLAQVSGETLNMDGMAVARVYYLGENGCIKTMEYKIPFSKSAELKSAPVRPVISIDLCVNYFNCRAVNQRRFDMRGAITLTVKVTGTKEEQAVLNAQGMGVQVKEKPCEVTENVSMSDKQFSVREELELPYGKPPMQSIIHTVGTMNMQDFKVIAGKIILKGELNLHTLYLSDSEKNIMDTVEHTIPISQIVDAEGVEDTCNCDVKCAVCTCDAQIKADKGGENRMLAIDTGLKAEVLAQKNKEVSIAADCYSTDYDCKCDEKSIETLCLLETVNDLHILKETITPPPGMSKIIDLWCEATIKEIKYTAGAAMLCGKVTVCLFGFGDNNSGVEYFEQELEFEHKIMGDCKGGTLELCARLCVASCSYTINNKLELTCEIRITGMLYCHRKENILTAITPIEANPKAKDNNVGMVVYFADEGESIWDIAKSHNTSMAKIAEENALENTDTTEKSVLLIPTV